MNSTHIQKIMEDDFTKVVTYSMIIVGLILLILLLVQVARATFTIKTFIKELRKDEENLFDRLEKKSVFGSRSFYKIWDRINYLVTKHREESDPKYIDIEKSYSSESVMPFFSKSGAFIPSTFISVGILFTFVGLASGLPQIEPSANGLYSPDEINMMLPGLINGVGLAFTSSIIGIVISIIYSFVHKISISYLDNRLSVMHFYFSSAIPILDENFFMNESYKLQQIQTESSVTLSNNLIDFLNQTTKQQIEGLKVIVDEFVIQMDKKLETQFSTLATTLEEFNSTQTNHLDYTKTITERINELSSSQSIIIAQNKETLSKFVTELDSSFNQIDESLAKTVSSINKSIGNFDEIQNGIMLATKENFGSLVEQLKNTQESLISNVEESVKTLDSSFTSQKTIQELTLEQNNTLRDVVNELSENINSVRSLLRESSDLLVHHEHEFVNYKSEVDERFEKEREYHTEVLKKIEKMNLVEKPKSNRVKRESFLNGSAPKKERNKSNVKPQVEIWPEKRG